MTSALPFAGSSGTQGDDTVLPDLSEFYLKKHPLPPLSMISDGTVNIAALITALFFQHDCMVIIKEPGLHTHPSLVPVIVEMMREASATRQIIITTHNPEIVRNANLEDLFAVWRNSKGYSEITIPSEQDEVKNFLENEMELHELYVQNLLGG